jgi:hypothetical protein
MIKLTDVEIKGRTFNVEVDERNGRFYTEMDGMGVYGESLADLKTELAKRMSRTSVKVNIPFVRWDNGVLMKGTITGIHAANKNILVKWEHKKGADQEYGYSPGVYINPDVGEQYVELSKANDRAAEVLEEFVKANQFNGREAVQKEMARLGTDGDL